MILPNNLGRQFSLNAAEYEQKAIEVLRSGWYILGKEVSAFEEEWADYIGSKYCVGLASGLDALWISFRLLDVKEGDEVKAGDIIAQADLDIIKKHGCLTVIPVIVSNFEDMKSFEIKTGAVRGGKSAAMTYKKA